MKTFILIGLIALNLFSFIVSKKSYYQLNKNLVNLTDMQTVFYSSVFAFFVLIQVILWVITFIFLLINF